VTFRGMTFLVGEPLGTTACKIAESWGLSQSHHHRRKQGEKRRRCSPSWNVSKAALLRRGRHFFGSVRRRRPSRDLSCENGTADSERCSPALRRVASAPLSETVLRSFARTSSRNYCTILSTAFLPGAGVLLQPCRHSRDFIVACVSTGCSSLFFRCMCDWYYLW